MISRMRADPSSVSLYCRRSSSISHFMSPQSAYLQAGHLYDRYKEYFEIE